MSKSLMFLIAILFTGIFALIGWNRYFKGKASETWPMVEGKILESGVNEVEIKRDGVLRNSYDVHVRYEYIVDGQRLTADKLSFSMAGTSRSRTEMAAIANAFPIGKTVPVYFNPDKPTEACLDKGVQDSPLFAGLWSIGFLSFLKSSAPAVETGVSGKALWLGLIWIKDSRGSESRVQSDGDLGKYLKTVLPSR